jgi:glycosyltransferase involved in cell wall biosynthesis
LEKSKEMKITIDASCLFINRYSGLSKVVHNLLLYLPRVDINNKFAVFINCFRNPKFADDISYPETINIISRIPRRLMALWWQLGWPPADFYFSETNIYHSLHIQIPPTRNVRTVLTVHDCRFLALPDLYLQREVEEYKNQMAVSLARADLVTTVSEFTRQEVMNYFSFPEDRMRVIRNGFDLPGMNDNYCWEEVELFIERNRLPRSFLLYIGVLDPRKNLQRLVEAIAHCRNETEDFPDLVIAGITQEQWFRSDQAIRAKELGVFDHIYLAGVVERDVLSGLTVKALALCYPSLYEGFGFPPLEAMSLGVPVLAGDCSAIPEITGPAACLVDPTNVNEIAEGLERIVFDDDYRQKLINLGYQQVKKFSWREAALKYINIYKEVLTL